MICPYCRTENRPGATRCSACTSWIAEIPPAREWVRAREGKMIAGVCRGLATRYGFAVAPVRLAFVLATCLGLWGLLAYVVLWIVMPLEPAPLPAAKPAEAPPPRAA
jgi:phage shock protein PspC (stress-responsive transcriptional regulator)